MESTTRCAVSVLKYRCRRGRCRSNRVCNISNCIIGLSQLQSIYLGVRKDRGARGATIGIS